MCAMIFPQAIDGRQLLIMGPRPQGVPGEQLPPLHPSFVYTLKTQTNVVTRSQSGLNKGKGGTKGKGAKGETRGSSDRFPSTEIGPSCPPVPDGVPPIDPPLPGPTFRFAHDPRRGEDPDEIPID